MPNWCSNRLRVTADTPEALQKFTDVAFKQHPDNPDLLIFTFEGIYPTPPELLAETAFGESENKEALVEKYGHSDWYGWRVENWGTKWDAGDSYVENPTATPDGKSEVEVSFDTAWAPPIPFLLKASEIFPELRFSLLYEEPGNDFCGYQNIQNGETLEAEEDRYEFFDETTGEQVEYDSETEKWCRIGTNEPVSDDADYWPDMMNRYESDWLNRSY